VRAAIADGEVTLAERLLGYAYTVDGIVPAGRPARADHRLPDRERAPGGPAALPAGERASTPCARACASEAGGRTAWYPAVANLGRRPTFDGQSLLLEVHLLEGGGDLYGRRLRVAFVERLRGEQKFGGIDELKAQIARDSERARAVHADRLSPIPA
jgi:riboflavin kinase/FMN adenylyltransferase